MADFNIRSESVDVEQIMKQIRSRIREKRGVDYTEEQIRELATVRLEKFLDPKNLRSDLLEQFRRSRPAPPDIPKEPPPIEPPYVFDDQTLFHSHRSILRTLRRLFMPVLKLFFNPNTLNQVLHAQAQFNIDMLKRDARRKIEFQTFERSRAEWNVLYYEVLHNLVLETTRQTIEVKNLKMRVEALASRLDFSERRVRALEGVVQYRPEIVRPRQAPPRAELTAAEGPAVSETTETPGAAPPPAGEGARRRRRRRRGRRGAGVPQPGATQPAGDQSPGADPEAEAQEADFANESGFEGDGGDPEAANDAFDSSSDDAASTDDDLSTGPGSDDEQ